MGLGAGAPYIRGANGNMGELFSLTALAWVYNGWPDNSVAGLSPAFMP
jgi:hypothetical protein